MKARVKSGGLKKEMFGYRSNVPKVRLTTDRLVVRLVHDRDAWRLADYYAENKAFLKPWEPVRDDSHCYPSGWQARLSMIAEFHKQGSAFYFALLDPEEKEIIGVANFSNVVRGSFHACYLGYSIGEKWQGQGLMFEALTSAIRYMQRTQHIHRIMANYMPHNQRSGALLARLGFEKEGYAKDYLLIDGQWRDHVLTLTGYYMLAVQVMLMLPIMVNDIAGSPAAVKWMYAIEATISLTLLYPIARWSEKRFRLEHRLMAGLLVMTLAMLPIGMTSSLQQLFTLICLFYIGSIIAEPARETLGASLADARARGSYMGFSRLGLAFGGALGYAGGGWLFDAGKAVGQPELPWLMLGAIGVITFLALWWQFSPKRSASGMLEPRT